MSVGRVYIHHVRGAKLCMGGSRKWFKDRGWSWSKFLDEGWSAQEFTDTGCPLAARVVTFAEAESDGVK